MISIPWDRMEKMERFWAMRLKTKKTMMTSRTPDNGSSLILSSGRRSSGFTLIEILIVMSIIGVLAGMVLIAMGSIQKGAKDEATKALVERLNLYLSLIHI